MQEQEKERNEKVLENLDSLEKRQRIRKILITGIIVVFVAIVLFLIFSFYTYFKSPEKTLGIGANIESALISEDGKTAFIKLKGGSFVNITKIKFIFNDLNQNEYNYETSDGVQEIEVPFKKSFWDWLFGKQLKGIYDYEINSENAGLSDFNNINEVGVLFEYQTGTGEVIETRVLDTQRTTNRTTIPSGSSGPSSTGGTTPTTTCTDTCNSFGYKCGNYTICSTLTNCGTCNLSSQCISGSCVEIITGTCNDGIKNQNETGIDCGGVCVSGVETLCSDGLDNDKDCLIDNIDFDCVESWSFVTVSDSYGGFENGLRTCFETALVYEPDVKFLISTGDFQNSDTIDSYFQTRLMKYFPNQTYVPWFNGIGNHNCEDTLDLDWNQNVLGARLSTQLPGLTNFRTGPPYNNTGCGRVNTTYSFDYNNAHFIMINHYADAMDSGGGFACVSEYTLDWLEQDLKANTKPLIFVFGHEPAFPNTGGNQHCGDSLDDSRCSGNNNTGGLFTKSMRDRFWKLLSDHNVVANFAGHLHSYYARQIHNVSDFYNLSCTLSAGGGGCSSQSSCDQGNVFCCYSDSISTILNGTSITPDGGVIEFTNAITNAAGKWNVIRVNGSKITFSTYSRNSSSSTIDPGILINTFDYDASSLGGCSTTNECPDSECKIKNCLIGQCVYSNEVNGTACVGGNCLGGGCVSSCTENWQCNSWSNCVAGTKTRTCTDINNCGTELSKPAEQQNCVVAAGNWIPPIGIPRPEFGIEESYRMYDNISNRNPNLTYRQNTEGGFYTYYVDNSVACSDTNNNGTESNPRCTIPYVGLGSHTYLVQLKPGDIMEIHGIHNLKEIRPDGWLDGYEFTGVGTSENPAFVRGDSDNPAVITTTQPDSYGNVLAGSYIILENFEFNNSLVAVRASNSAIRNCEIYNIERVNGRAVSISSAKDFVFYNNNVHHNWGTWPDGSKDMHNIAVTGFSERIWIVDNELHHASYNLNGTIAKTGGDAIQIMGDYCETMVDPSIWPNKIFIGRNDMHHNTENSVDIKCSHNVVISQNEAYEDGFTPYSSASMINHEHANNTWFIFNKVHDVRVGIRPEDAIGEAFVIGNVIYNIKYPVSSGTIYGNFVGGVYARIVPTHIIENTFYNVTGGALIPSDSGNCTIVNNLISLVPVPYPGNLSWYHAGVEVGGDADEHTIIDYNLFYQPLGVEEYVPDGVVKLRWGSSVYEGLENFTKTGKCLNCIEADPLFTNEENYNFSLQQGSPALDSGTDEGIVQEIMQKYFDTFGESINVDFEGNPRPQGAKWDIGAYEYVLPPRAIYVDNSLAGDCNNYNPAARTCGSGTETAYNNLADATAIAVVGDSVLIRGGNYNEIFKPNNSGAEGNEITYQSYNNESVAITGTATDARLASHPDDPNYNYGSIWFEYVNYIIVDGLNFSNVEGFGRITRSHNNTFKNCNFDSLSTDWIIGLNLFESHNNKFENNFVQGTSDNFRIIHSDRNVFENNEFHHGRHVLLTFKCSSYNIIRDNYFYNEDQKVMEVLDCEQPTMFDHYNIYYQNISIVNSAKYNLIENNTFAYTAPEAGHTDGPFNHIQYAGQNGIIRNNLFYNSNGIALGMARYGTEAGYNKFNRIYNNVFYNNTGGGVQTSRISLDLFDNIFKNNIFYKNLPGPLHWADDSPGGSQITHGGIANFLFENNNIINNTLGDAGIIYNSYNHTISLATAQTNYPSLYKNNLEVNPEFVNADAHDFSLQSDSPMIDAGMFLTNTTGAGSGTTMQVRDAGYFYDGFGIEGQQGDLIQLDGQTATARIVDIDYATNTLTLDTSLTWTAEQGISLAYKGNAPDIGAYEYQGDAGGAGTLSPFTKILSLIKNILTGKTENVLNEVDENGESKVPYIILSLLAVIILIIAIIIVKIKSSKKKSRKKFKKTR